MILEAIQAGILIGDFIYHRWQDPRGFLGDGPVPLQGFQTKIQLPTSTEGAVIPLLYGKTRVKAPVMTWWGTAQAHPGSDVGSSSPYVYSVNMFFVLGIPFSGGVARVKSMWAGERLLGGSPYLQTGNGNHETPITTDTSVMAGDAGFIGGLIEPLNGNSSQVLVDGALASKTWAADKMIAFGVPPQQIPGFRGYLSAFLHNGSSTSWYIGPNPQPDAYSFEATSYPSSFLGDSGVNTTIGDDANPVAVIYDLLTGTLGKLGLAISRIDNASFIAAALTLQNESHGFSRSWEQSSSAGELINEVLRQIDGVMFEDPLDGLLKIKLIRADYLITDLANINPSNCESLESFGAGGWTDVTNKVRVTFSNRFDNYRDGSGVAFNQANALNQDGEVREVVLQMPGITLQAVANTVAQRELAYRSRPLMKCRAIVNRSFYRQTNGNAITLTWPEANISNLVFRVANVTRGTLEAGKIALDLIQDGFYNQRQRPPVVGGTPAFPGGGVVSAP